MQMNTSLSRLPQLHQRKDNVGIDSAIIGGLIHPEIKQEGKKYIWSFSKLCTTFYEKIEKAYFMIHFSIIHVPK